MLKFFEQNVPPLATSLVKHTAVHTNTSQGINSSIAIVHKRTYMYMRIAGMSVHSRASFLRISKINAIGTNQDTIGTNQDIPAILDIPRAQFEIWKFVPDLESLFTSLF